MQVIAKSPSSKAIAIKITITEINVNKKIIYGANHQWRKWLISVFQSHFSFLNPASMPVRHAIKVEKAKYISKIWYIFPEGIFSINIRSYGTL